MIAVMCGYYRIDTVFTLFSIFLVSFPATLVVRIVLMNSLPLLPWLGVYGISAMLSFFFNPFGGAEGMLFLPVLPLLIFWFIWEAHRRIKLDLGARYCNYREGYGYLSEEELSHAAVDGAESGEAADLVGDN